MLKPAQQIQEMFRQPYLTRLYTTMSPDEMTQDPMFVFNADLPKVSNLHEARGVRKCSADVAFSQAPVELTLKNGIKFTVSGFGGAFGSVGTGKPIAMPAALRIEQLKSVGAASVVTDNQAKIAAAVAPTANGATAVAVDPSSGKAVAVPRIAGGDSSTGGGTGTGGGFGCAGCANPAKTAGAGKGEGLTFALFLAGLLGWRRWQRRS